MPACSTVPVDDGQNMFDDSFSASKKAAALVVDTTAAAPDAASASKNFQEGSRKNSGVASAPQDGTSNVVVKGSGKGFVEDPIDYSPKFFF